MPLKIASMKKTLLIIAFILFSTHSLTAQVYFNTELKKNNPVSENAMIPIQTKIKIHQDYLQKAIAEKNQKNQLFGFLYLYSDYLKNGDYLKVNDNLLKAENLAKKSKNLTWLGMVTMYRGFTKTNGKAIESLKYFELALKYCTASKDSICMAENLEQLSAAYGELEDFEKSHYYFKLAIPLLKKCKNQKSIATAYNNYSNTLCYEKKYDLAKKYIDSAIAISVINKDFFLQASQQNNKAALYIDAGKYDSALTIYKRNESIIKKNNWKNQLLKNQYGQSISYEKKGNYQEALGYLQDYYSLKDSINGIEVNTKIVTLETQYKYQKKELDYKKNRLNLLVSNQRLERYTWLFSIGIGLVLLGLWLWRKQITQTKKELALNQKKLTDLTSLLIEKNGLLLAQDEKIGNQNIQKEEIIDHDLESSFYNQRILTNSDWASFKTYFEKVYPSYIKKLRDAYPTITDAEERLFLCLKINLKNRETAAMLGISSDSVKKNRNRLRKKLDLTEKDDLEEFVRSFTKRQLN